MCLLSRLKVNCLVKQFPNIQLQAFLIETEQADGAQCNWHQSSNQIFEYKDDVTTYYIIGPLLAGTALLTICVDHYVVLLS